MPTLMLAERIADLIKQQASEKAARSTVQLSSQIRHAAADFGRRGAARP
jgi:hypothetical protein